MEFGYWFHHLINQYLKTMLNTSSNLYKTEWLDLVFKNRNQSYGAYALRSQSGSNTMRALFIAAPLFILLFAGPKIYSLVKGKPAVDENISNPDRIIDVIVAPRVEKTRPVEKVAVPKSEPAPKNIKTVKLPANPKVVNTPVEIDPPTLIELDRAAIGAVTQAGIGTNAASVPAEGNGDGAGMSTGSGTGAENSEIIEMGGAEIYPEFEGGMKGWSRYLERNLRYPAVAQEKGIKGKVFVSFVVEKDGSISNVVLIKGVDGSVDEEAMRVIKKSPKWRAGIQNGMKVRVRFTMPISFTMM